MKNILMLTNIYPNNDPDYGGTVVCHSFTKEWASMGYNIRVIHFDSLFPRPYYWLGKLFNERIQAKTGTVAYTKTPRRAKHYLVDEIPVLFVPLKKLVPHKAFSKRQIQKAFNYVVGELENDDFMPDVVTAHFVMPQLQFLPLFKERYPHARTCLVLHGSWTLMSSVYPERYESLMESVDVWGFRSLAFQKSFEKRFGVRPNEFLCHSGIPEKYIERVERDFNSGVRRFVFVGSLYELKNVDVTMRALRQAMGDKDFTFDIVGGGAESDNLHRLAKELGIENKVVFHGQMKRDDAQQIVREADCFIMVSSREAFGLVYVEAMAKGCIVIGTKGQGIDGIVKNGENGFLCKARDIEGLAQMVKHIVGLTPIELKLVSENAVATAKELTDRKVAEHYINTLIS